MVSGILGVDDGTAVTRPPARIATPHVPAPPPFPERRVAVRRETDRLAVDGARLLARSLDALAADRTAEERLADLLELLARTVGAERAAVLTERPERRIAVASADDPASRLEAEGLAAWLDAHTPRTRASRAASGPATVATLVARARRSARRPLPRPICALRPVPGSGGTFLGFAFRGGRAAAAADQRLPLALARHAAVALALVTTQVIEERELVALRARDTHRGSFVSTVAHELRTPLTSLAGYLDLILDERVDDEEVRREFLARGRGLVADMTDLVTDLLEMSRLEAGSIELEPAAFSLAEAGQAVVETLHPQALARRITLEGRFGSRLRTAWADRRRVTQVLVNLAGNALKFTPEGGHVRLEAAFEGLVALVMVRDDGTGIAPEDHVRIFDRFTRTPGAAGIVGTGLGLAIARELARTMGGDLDVASVEGRGSSFVLALPCGPTVTEQEVTAVLTRALERETAQLSAPAPPATPWPIAAASQPAVARLSLAPAGRGLATLNTRRLRGVDGALAVAD